MLRRNRITRTLLRWVGTLAVASSLAVAGQAQEPAAGSLAPLQNGNLVLWIVVPHRNPQHTDKPRIVPNGAGVQLIPREPRADASDSAKDPEENHDPQWDLLYSHLVDAFPELQADFEYLYEEDVSPSLTGAQGTADWPDVLLWADLPARGPRQWSFGVQVNWSHFRVPQTEAGEPANRDRHPVGAVLMPAPLNAEAARAFVTWLADDGEEMWLAGAAPHADADADGVAEYATRILRRLLSGGSVGSDADLEMAGITSSRAGFQVYTSSLGDIRTDVASVWSSGTTAVVALRGSGFQQTFFDVVHVMLVLRKDVRGQWRVLQVSWNLAPDLVHQGATMLASATSAESSLHRNEGDQPLAVSQASPANGEIRPPQPELWWDNRGGATLQVVEWQPGPGAEPGLQSSLYFVPDTGPRLKTSVVARFAERGTYRWRVWSVGAEGTIVVGSWRTLKIVAR